MSKTLDWVLMEPGFDTCPCGVCRQRRALRSLIRDQEIPDLYALRAAVIDLLGGKQSDAAVVGETHAPRDG
jgi:hypothetical protein